MDELARAYATLGTSDAASLEDVRKRYKALVRKWHPDRFASDPQGQAEAAVRMRAINDAFRTVVAHRGNAGPGPGFPPGQASSPGTPPSWHSGRRLTREEIDRMVELMGNDGPLDWLTEGPWFQLDPRVGRPVAAAALALAVAVFLAMAADVLGMSETGTLAIGALTLVAAFGILLQRLPKA